MFLSNWRIKVQLRAAVRITSILPLRCCWHFHTELWIRKSWDNEIFHYLKIFSNEFEKGHFQAVNKNLAAKVNKTTGTCTEFQASNKVPIKFQIVKRTGNKNTTLKFKSKYMVLIYSLLIYLYKILLFYTQCVKK